MKKLKTFILPLAAAFVLLSSFALLTLKPVDTDDAVTFTIKNFGLNTSGKLKGLKGDIKWDEQNVAASSFTVSADVNTINTGVEGRDNHLKKEDYFNVAKYPTITFTSTGITNTNGAYSVTGNISIKGTTKTISFPFTVLKTSNGYVFDGSFNINRKDYNIGGGSMVLSDDANVHLKVQAIQ